jgi:FkbM family methyltransferase
MPQLLVFDIGMHIGEDADYHLACGHRVVSVEADPKLVEDGRKRFAKEISEGRLTIVNCAVGETDGEATFWICPSNRTLNSFSREGAARAGEEPQPVRVPVRRFTTLVKEFGLPDYLKIDIEGHDHVVLRDIDPANRPKFVSWEMSSIEDVLTVRSKGYNAFKCVSQVTLRPIELGSARGSIVRPSEFATRERLRGALSAVPGALPLARKIVQRARGGQPDGPVVPTTVRTVTLPSGKDYDFPLGASGPFGETLGGEWQAAETVIYQYLDYWLNVGRFAKHGDYGDWFDMHATTLPADQTPTIGSLHA